MPKLNKKQMKLLFSYAGLSMILYVIYNNKNSSKSTKKAAKNISITATGLLAAGLYYYM